MVEPHPPFDALRTAVELACQSQNGGRIVAGRQQVLSLPRSWVLEWLEPVAQEVLNLSDYWEYRRLLELAEMLDIKLLKRLVSRNLASTDPDVREAAEDYSSIIKDKLSEFED